ncbi:hypothetical protein PAXRUDRAFT_668277 [Paxillus rubicundulus Ve08.2h10]|uniref:Uncharacterized protein n=1 Tax=Paxillus rubicundulus Ve08.2h10 TaxID=930991 RepID=A0A0D0E8J9_9AGAM|nr:hypothetical protein PAXRUDRAFT_668277 [Paxillus rubicundulus Ve08.2h10]
MKRNGTMMGEGHLGDHRTTGTQTVFCGVTSGGWCQEALDTWGASNRQLGDASGMGLSPMGVRGPRRQRSTPPTSPSVHARMWFVVRSRVLPRRRPPHRLRVRRIVFPLDARVTSMRVPVDVTKDLLEGTLLNMRLFYSSAWCTTCSRIWAERKLRILEGNIYV